MGVRWMRMIAHLVTYDVLRGRIEDSSCLGIALLPPAREFHLPLTARTMVGLGHVSDGLCVVVIELPARMTKWVLRVVGGEA